MKRMIMVLFDSDSIREEAIHYSFELAKRMDSSLILLAVLSVEGWENTRNAIDPMYQQGFHANKLLNDQIQTMKNKDVSMEVAVRIGNPRSELLKYLAENSRVQTIVWGGNPDAIRRKNHWLVQMKDILECPVVTPYKKDPVEHYP
jgi:hypothetical protein